MTINSYSLQGKGWKLREVKLFLKGMQSSQYHVGRFSLKYELSHSEQISLWHTRLIQ